MKIVDKHTCLKVTVSLMLNVHNALLKLTLSLLFAFSVCFLCLSFEFQLRIFKHLALTMHMEPLLYTVFLK
jgi:hypothetical protein